MCFSANIQYFLKYIFPAVSTSGDRLGFNCLCFEIFVSWTILIGIIHFSVTAQSVIDPPNPPDDTVSVSMFHRLFSGTCLYQDRILTIEWWTLFYISSFLSASKKELELLFLLACARTMKQVFIKYALAGSMHTSM